MGRGSVVVRVQADGHIPEGAPGGCSREGLGEGMDPGPQGPLWVEAASSPRCPSQRPELSGSAVTAPRQESVVASWTFPGPVGGGPSKDQLALQRKARTT